MRGKLCVIAWCGDIAGMNIVSALREKVEFNCESVRIPVGNTIIVERWIHPLLDVLIVTTDTVSLENIDSALKGYSFVIFASRHESAKKIPSLLIHAPGNLLDENPLGGLPFSLCYAHGGIMLRIFKVMYERYRESKYFNLGWDCTYEATHHGPYVKNVPVCFVEIGSTISEWKEKEAANIIADAILNVSKARDIKEYSFVGFSGLHYASVLSRKCAMKDIPLGHIIPRYVISKALDKGISLRKIIKLAVSRSIGFKGFVFEKKGLKSKQKQEVLKIIEEEYASYDFIKL